MNLNRRNFLAAAGLSVMAGMAKSAKAASERTELKGKTYVAACPPVTEKIPRTPGPQRVEVYEISEYGRPPIEEDFDLLMG